MENLRMESNEENLAQDNQHNYNSIAYTLEANLVGMRSLTVGMC